MLRYSTETLLRILLPCNLLAELFKILNFCTLVPDHKKGFMAPHVVQKSK